VRVFENRVLWRTFQTKRNRVTGGWRKLNVEYLHNYSLPSTIGTIKSRRMRRSRHVAGIRKKRKECRIFLGNREEMRPMRRSLLEWIALKWFL
jgi:hypothetical protein